MDIQQNHTDNTECIKYLFAMHGFVAGMIISMSKSKYRRMHPLNLVVFNASIQVIPKIGDEFWIEPCDVDLTKSHKKLLELSKTINGSILVYGERRHKLMAHYYKGQLRYRVPWHPILWKVRSYLRNWRWHLKLWMEKLKRRR